nr:biotin/lipoyl-containing protein [Isoptericola sp. b490]
MPRLGETMTDGTINIWLKKVGDPVVAGEPLLEIGTDKVDTEVECPATGILSEILVGEDETVDIGVRIGTITGDG